MAPSITAVRGPFGAQHCMDSATEAQPASALDSLARELSETLQSIEAHRDTLVQRLIGLQHHFGDVQPTAASGPEGKAPQPPVSVPWLHQRIRSTLDECHQIAEALRRYIP